MDYYRYFSAHGLSHFKIKIKVILIVMNSLIATNRLYIIVGLGLTGLSVARYLTEKSIYFAVMDHRSNSDTLTELKKINPDVQIYLGDFNVDILLSASVIVLSPGVPRKTLEIAQAIDSGVTVINDIGLFLQEVSVPVIGITGSNGKSTVTTLVGMAAKDVFKNVVVAGNIGVPVLDVFSANVDLYIL